MSNPSTAKEIAIIIVCVLIICITLIAMAVILPGFQKKDDFWARIFVEFLLFGLLVAFMASMILQIKVLYTADSNKKKKIKKQTKNALIVAFTYFAILVLAAIVVHYKTKTSFEDISGVDNKTNNPNVTGTITDEDIPGGDNIMMKEPTITLFGSYTWDLRNYTTRIENGTLIIENKKSSTEEKIKLPDGYKQSSQLNVNKIGNKIIIMDGSTNKVLLRGNINQDNDKGYPMIYLSFK